MEKGIVSKFMFERNKLTDSSQSQNIKISEQREKLIKAITSCKKLQEIIENVSKNIDQDWKLLNEQTNQLKLEINLNLDSFLKNNNLHNVEMKLKRHIKKRQRNKKLKIFNKEQKCLRESELNKFKEDQDLINDEIEKKLKLLKKESDVFEDDAKRGKQECLKQIRLLESLKKLIKAREHQKISRGEKVHQLENIRALERIDEKLDEWKFKLEEFESKITKINELLSDSNKIIILANNSKKPQQTHKLWDQAFFQEPFENYMSSSDLISIRHSWDKYAIHFANAEERIPIGWVKPSRPSSSIWGKYLINQE